MTVETTTRAHHAHEKNATGASFHAETDWHVINWQAVNHTVRRRAPRESSRQLRRADGTR
jgi:hypothetical protein